MKDQKIVIEDNMGIAYNKYFEIVLKGLENTNPTILRSITENGAKCFLIKYGDDLPSFLAIPLTIEFDKYDFVQAENVIAVEWIEGSRNLQEIFEFLPDALAMSAVCTAGKVHKFKGGAREGAGRKPSHPDLKKEPVSIKLPHWLINWMDRQEESRAVLIEFALRYKHKIKPPNRSTT